METDSHAVPESIVQDQLPSNPQACICETSSSNSIQVDKTTPSTVSVTQVTKSRCAVAASANKGDTPSDSGQEKLEKQRELVESMFPGEKVHYNAICPNCSKDCGNFKHEWLHKKELAFCPETKIWWLAFVEGKGMFCLLCRKHDCQNPQNKSAVFNKTPATWYRPASLKKHVGTPLSPHSHPGKRKQQHQDAIYREMLQRTSFFQKQLDEERL